MSVMPNAFGGDRGGGIQKAVSATEQKLKELAEKLWRIYTIDDNYPKEVGVFLRQTDRGVTRLELSFTDDFESVQIDVGVIDERKLGWIDGLFDTMKTPSSTRRQIMLRAKTHAPVAPKMKFGALSPNSKMNWLFAQTQENHETLKSLKSEQTQTNQLLKKLLEKGVEVRVDDADSGGEGRLVFTEAVINHQNQADISDVQTVAFEKDVANMAEVEEVDSSSKPKITEQRRVNIDLNQLQKRRDAKTDSDSPNKENHPQISLDDEDWDEEDGKKKNKSTKAIEASKETSGRDEEGRGNGQANASLPFPRGFGGKLPTSTPNDKVAPRNIQRPNALNAHPGRGERGFGEKRGGIENCYRCNKPGHKAFECNRDDKVCMRCNKEGHIKYDCPLNKSNAMTNPGNNRPFGSWSYGEKQTEQSKKFKGSSGEGKPANFHQSGKENITGNIIATR